MNTLHWKECIFATEAMPVPNYQPPLNAIMLSLSLENQKQTSMIYLDKNSKYNNISWFPKTFCKSLYNITFLNYDTRTHTHTHTYIDIYLWAEKLPSITLSFLSRFKSSDVDLFLIDFWGNSSINIRYSKNAKNVKQIYSLQQNIFRLSKT